MTTIPTPTLTTPTSTTSDVVPTGPNGLPSWFVTGDATKAPYPWPGGKSRVAGIVWERLGNVDNYLESFAGSVANLLFRPADHFANGYRVETVNDLNHYVVNFWRAVADDPDGVARFADWPVTETDLHARHDWLVKSAESVEFRQRLIADPTAFDSRIAGWWVWGQCCWIGSGWCDFEKYERNRNGKPATQADRVGEGVNRTDRQAPMMGDAGNGVLGRPQLADAYDIGRGVNSGGNMTLQKPNIGQECGTGGIGVNGVGPGPTGQTTRQVPNLTGDTHYGVQGMAGGGTCDARRAWLTAWMRRLSDRFRIVRTLYGHWKRIGDSKSTLTRLGCTGIFLDPPYPLKRKVGGKKSRADKLYTGDDDDTLERLRDEVFEYCLQYGPEPDIRIALCCYEGDGYEGLADVGWDVVEWEASGGYGNQGGKKSDNARRERIYFSPACLKPTNRTKSLFE